MRYLQKHFFRYVAPLILTLSSLSTIYAADPKFVTLKSRGGKKYKIEKEVACISEKLKGCIDGSLEQKKELRKATKQISSKTLKTFIASLQTMHKGWPVRKKVFIPLRLQPLINELVQDRSLDQIMDLLLVANDMKVPLLVNAYARVYVQKETNKPQKKAKKRTVPSTIVVYLKKHQLLKDRYEKSIADIKDLAKKRKKELLDLQYEDLTSFFDGDSIEYPDSIKCLWLYQNSIGTVDPQFDTKSWQKFTQLKELHLDNNQLTAFPQIGSLTHLKKLNLSSNRITFLSDEIGNLTRLEELLLEDNKLIVLSDQIGNLIKLKELRIYNNKLTTIPHTIGSCTQLGTLYLHTNQLTNLPDKIGNLIKLNSLSLNGNKLTAIPETIGALTQLEELYLFDNPLPEEEQQRIKKVMPNSTIYFIKPNH